MNMRTVFLVLTAFGLLGLCAAYLVFSPDRGKPRRKGPPLADGVKIDRLVVSKKNRTLELRSNGSAVRTYKIALGFSPEGAKRCQGDGKTPEGSYVIDYRNPNSKFHLSLHVSYPDKEDRKLARERNCSPGGDIMIHGLGKRYAFLGPLQHMHDWTAGCVAVTNQEIEEIWRLVPNGTPIEINP